MGALRPRSPLMASAMLSAGGIRQQFSLPVNIQLSLYGVDFLRRLADELQVPGSPPPDAQFKEQGYLFLASAQGEATLRRNQATQLAQGVSWTRLLSPDALRRRFPWLNVDGVALGCVGEQSGLGLGLGLGRGLRLGLGLGIRLGLALGLRLRLRLRLGLGLAKSQPGEHSEGWFDP